MAEEDPEEDEAGDSDNSHASFDCSSSARLQDDGMQMLFDSIDRQTVQKGLR